MEKMQGELYDMVVPALVQKLTTSKTTSTTVSVSISSIALTLLHIIKSFHKEGRILVDVKAENFMLAFTNGTNKTNKALPPPTTTLTSNRNDDVATGLSSKIRILDLGLLTEWKCGSEHKPDVGVSNMAGTPLYASLNVHELHTPSRRDDLESIGYIIAELIIRIIAATNGTTSKYEGNNDEMPSYLPWSHEPSDEAIGEMKRKQVENLNSEFYKRLGDKKTAKIMNIYFKKVMNYGYKQTPDYDELEKILCNLTVMAQNKKKKPAAAAKSKIKNTTTSVSRKRRSSDRLSSKRAAAAALKNDEELEEDDEESPAKIQKVIAIDDDDVEHFADAVEGSPEQMDIDSQPSVEFQDANENMDWEPTTNINSTLHDQENHEPETSKRGEGLGVRIVIEEGPHTGEEFILQQKGCQKIVVGREPKSSRTESTYCLPHDDEISGTHARLTLKVTSRQVCSVTVTDLRSTNGIMVGSNKVKKGGSVQAFVNDKIYLGKSTFSLLSNSSKKRTTTPRKKPAAKKRAAAVAKSPPPPATTSRRSSNMQTTKVATKSVDAMKLNVISGPHKVSCTKNTIDYSITLKVI